MTSRDETTATTPEEHEELRQERLSKFGRILAIVGLVYISVHFFFSIWLHQPLFDIEVLPELVATAAALLGLGRRGQPAVRRHVLDRVLGFAEAFTQKGEVEMAVHKAGIHA